MTKEEAIKSFDEENGIKKYIASLNKNHPSYQDYLKIIERNEMAISALKGGWIPIEEREPEDIGNYIVTLDYDVHGRVVSQCFYHGKTIRWADFNDSVTAWREDIEPYKGESEE
ncbi:MAG: hypothetical protein IJ819_00265 [Clostridiales bacterium]|nr:hypothetical protein [Clostridiales bacterium]